MPSTRLLNQLITTCKGTDMKCEYMGERPALLVQSEVYRNLNVFVEDHLDGTFSVRASIFGFPHQHRITKARLNLLCHQAGILATVGSLDDILIIGEGTDAGWYIDRRYDLPTNTDILFKAMFIVALLRYTFRRVAAFIELEQSCVDQRTGEINTTYLDRRYLRDGTLDIVGIHGEYAKLIHPGIDLMVIGTPTGYLLPITLFTAGIRNEYVEKDGAFDNFMTFLHSATAHHSSKKEIHVRNIENNSDLISIFDNTQLRYNESCVLIAIEITDDPLKPCAIDELVTLTYVALTNHSEIIHDIKSYITVGKPKPKIKSGDRMLDPEDFIETTRNFS